MNDVVVANEKNGELVSAEMTNLVKIEADIDESIVNLKDIADQAALALREAIEFASAAQNPKCYEAVAKLIVAATNANRELSESAVAKLQLYKGTKKEEEKVGTTNINEQVNNNLYVSSNDLLDTVIKKR